MDSGGRPDPAWPDETRLLRVLILGGYGVFGGRLATLLCDVAGLELLIGGRSLTRAQVFCAAFRGAAVVRPLLLDRSRIAEALRDETPDMVVDASGPFQDYGADRYHVIACCIAAGVDYLDFADGADFVFGVSQFDAQAKAAGVAVLSGVSSFPVLTAAVLRAMARSMEIVSVEGGIAPSPYAGVGLNVMRAVVGYAGGPITLMRGGRLAVAAGLAESRRFTVAVPGAVPLRNLRFSLVDVPDLRIIPAEYPAMTDLWIGAGPVPEILHRVLNLLAKARARFGLPSFAPLAPLFHAVLNRMRFGEHRGGMLVRAVGRVGGREVVRSWHLLAEGDDGPLIPSMAIEALIRRTRRGERPAPGARPAGRALELEDYQALFRNRAIRMGFRDEDVGAPLYRQILGSAFDTLPARVRDLHAGTGARCWTGTAEVRRGPGLAARLVAALVGFPAASSSVPVTVRFTPVPEGERWSRDFGGKRLTSVQSAGTGRDRFLLVERFGMLRVSLALACEGGRLFFVPRRWAILGVPLPRWLIPEGSTFEAEIDGRFHFDVTIRAPLIGLIVGYRGTLEADTAATSDGQAHASCVPGPQPPAAPAAP